MSYSMQVNDTSNAYIDSTHIITKREKEISRRHVSLPCTALHCTVLCSIFDETDTAILSRWHNIKNRHTTRYKRAKLFVSQLFKCVINSEYIGHSFGCLRMQELRVVTWCRSIMFCRCLSSKPIESTSRITFQIGTRHQFTSLFPLTAYFPKRHFIMFTEFSLVR